MHLNLFPSLALYKRQIRGVTTPNQVRNEETYRGWKGERKREKHSRFHVRKVVTTRQREPPCNFSFSCLTGNESQTKEKKRQTALSRSRSALRKWGYTVTIVFNLRESRRCPSASNHRREEQRSKVCASRRIDRAKQQPVLPPSSSFFHLPPVYSHHFAVPARVSFLSTPLCHDLRGGENRNDLWFVLFFSFGGVSELLVYFYIWYICWEL